jgi:UDP-N-acetylmuramoyl-tripeptide--D-alanyl-D-alanine ligase
LDGSAIDWEESRIKLPLPGAHNVRNALGAIAVARELGCGAPEVKEGLESMEAFFGRGEVLRGDLTVYQDCYNANLESLGAAIDFCDSVEWPAGRKLYVLGSLLELGDSSRGIHAQVGRMAAASNADALFLYGSEMEDAYEAAVESGYPGRLLWSDKAEDIAEGLKAFARSGDLVLMKGSRGMRMERFSQEILFAAGGRDAC